MFWDTITMKEIYRGLTDDEIAILISQGCSAEDWNLVRVTQDFAAENVVNVKFSGAIRLGRFAKTARLPGGVSLKTGIYNTLLHNCTVEDDVLIHDVRGYIANYHIKEGTVIHNVTTLAVDGETGFGNGIFVDVINEAGGRAVPIFDHLSAQTAYIMALYRHRPGLIEILNKMVMAYAEEVTSSSGTIGKHSFIINSNTIRNVKMGDATRIEGAEKLENGSINSNFEAPVSIGSGVIMEDFIVSSGSRVNDATLVSRCFIGQGCILDKHYSADNSLFFANCQGFHGEACSIFAGPYTVTHHKSTLLIAGTYLFLNAGSGSNQSNHLYKLGPVHQGIAERGVKTTSDSYVLWPSRIGAFSLIMGRHYKHCDTSDFPFSYIIESNDETVLVPAINLQSVGTIRDSKKWPKRDRRSDSHLLDKINFNLLSPYTVRSMMRGRNILLEIKNVSGSEPSEYSYKEMKIRRSALERGIKLYEMAIWKFMGNSLITMLKDSNIVSAEQLPDVLKKEMPAGGGEWVDLAGMVCPTETINELLDDIEGGKITTIEDIENQLQSIHENYYRYEWTWAYGKFEEFYGKGVADFTPEDVIAIVEKWKECVIGIDRLLYKDAQKEFSESVMTGFGIDGDDETKFQDFQNVRGKLEDNEMVVEILSHIERKSLLGDEIINMMKSLLNKED